MVSLLKPNEWPIASDEERAAGWREPRFDRRHKVDPHVPQWEERRGRDYHPIDHPIDDIGPTVFELIRNRLDEYDRMTRHSLSCPHAFADFRAILDQVERL